MAIPIEMIRGGERQTVYSDIKAGALEIDGWQRVSDLSPEKQAELASRPPLPWKGYDNQTYQEVLAQAAGLLPDQIAAIVAYESATKGRMSIVSKMTGVAPARFFQTSASAATEQPPVTIETVLEKPLETIETVQIAPAEDAPKG